MSESHFVCSLCEVSPASIACFCYRAPLPLCRTCLAFHIINQSTSHTAFNLPQSSPPNSHLQNSHKQFPKLQFPKTSNLKQMSKSLSQASPISDDAFIVFPKYNFLKEINPESELELSSFQSIMNAHIYVIAYSTQVILKYNLTKYTVSSVPLPIYTEHAKLFKLSSYDLILRSYGRFANKDIIFYSNSSASRFYHLARLSQIRIFEEVIYHDGFLYYFDKRGRLERLNCITMSIKRIAGIKYEGNYIPVALKKRIYFFTSQSSNFKVLYTDTFKIETAHLNDDISDNIKWAFAYEDKIYILTNSYTYLYDSNFNLISKTSRYYPLPSSYIHSYSILDDHIYFYHNTFQKFKVFCPAPLALKSPSHLNYINTRYILLTSSPSLVYRIDVKHSIAVPINLPFSSISSIIELTYDSFLIQNTLNWMLYNPSNNQSFAIQANIKLPANIHITYYDDYVYGFSKNAVYRLDLETRKWKLMLENVKDNKRKLCSCVGVEGRVYIIGGGNYNVCEYDIHTNKIRKVRSLSSKYAIAKAVGGVIYVIDDRGYQIYDHMFRALEEINWDNAEYEIRLKSNIGFYQSKVIFYNDSIGAMESIDLQTNKRKVQALEFINNR
jgi:hypothetical protein